MHLSYLNTSLRITCLILLISCISGLFASASGDEGNVSSAIDEQVYGNISIVITPEGKTTRPGMNIHPVISVENRDGEDHDVAFIIFQATLGREILLSDQSVFPAPKAGVRELYPLSFLIPPMQPGEYPLEILISIHTPGSEEVSDITKTRVREWIQVGLPEPASGRRSCGCT